MHRNRNLLTENSKTQNYDNNNNKDKIKQNIFFPTISQFNNGIINKKDTTNRNNYHFNKALDKGNNKDNINIFINNYKPKKRTFNIIRNGKDISKYISKDYKRKTNISDDILNFDSNDSNKNNNIFYLINEKDSNMTISNVNNINSNNKLYYKKNYHQKISKISLPFCVYNHNNQFLSGKNGNDIKFSSSMKKDLIPIFENGQFKNCPDLFNNKNENEENKVNDSNEDDMGNMTPNFLKPDYINEKIPKKILDDSQEEENNINEQKIDEENEEKEEKEEEETLENYDIDNELSERNNISIHNFSNRIRLPHEHRKKRNKFDNNGKIKNKTKSKSMFKNSIKENDDDDDNTKGNKLKVKSTPKSYNNRPKFIKVKKIELLRDYNI